MTVSNTALDNVKLHLVNTIDEAWEFKRWVGERHANDVLAADTETEGLNAYLGDRVRLIQIGDTVHGWAFPPEWHGAALEILDAWKNEWVYHNARFDLNWLRKQYGYRAPWHRVHDTITLAHLDDPTRTRALKRLAGMLIDPRAASSQQVLDNEMTRNGWDWKTVPIVRTGEGSSYWIYGALDPILTCRLFDIFKEVRSIYAAAYELEIGTVRCIADMEWRGARVDLGYCRKMIDVIGVYSKRTRAWIRDAHGVASAGSTMQCIAKFEELGRQITRFTQGGAKSLDKEMLQTLLIGADRAWGEEWERYGLDKLPGNDLAQALLDLRKYEKQVGPYFSNFERSVDSNNRVHATIWPCGTRTARMSITNPGLQTLPRKDPTVRDAFVPSDDHVLITCDADQIELRLATDLSRDEGLRQAFLSGDDFFNVIASQAFHTQITKMDPRRQTMKNGVYATLYGAGIPKIALTAGVPIHEMEFVMASFHERFPGIRRLQSQIEAVAKQRGEAEGRPYVFTGMGRKMYGDAGREYTLVNYAIQSSAAEVLKQGICDLDAAGLGEYMILPVHDEIVFDVPRENADDIRHEIERTLNNVGKDRFVPLTWSADVMIDRWGSKYR